MTFNRVQAAKELSDFETKIKGGLLENVIPAMILRRGVLNYHRYVQVGKRIDGYMASCSDHQAEEIYNDLKIFFSYYDMPSGYVVPDTNVPSSRIAVISSIKDFFETANDVTKNVWLEVLDAIWTTSEGSNKNTPYKFSKQNFQYNMHQCLVTAFSDSQLVEIEAAMRGWPYVRIYD